MSGFNWAGFVSVIPEDITLVGNARGNMKILAQVLDEGFEGMKPISEARKRVLVRSIEKFTMAATELKLLLEAFSADLECREAGIDPTGNEG
jgi:hypothetical protein